MTLDVASFTFGAILCAAALLGGGFKVGGKVEIPRIHFAARITCGLLGVLFLVVAFWWSSRANTAPGNPSPTVPSKPTSGTAPTTEGKSGGNVYFGPISGELRHNPGGDFTEWQLAGVRLRNFVLDVTFVNPYPASEQPWGFGTSFRIAGESSYRVAVASDRKWIYGYWTKGEWTELASGEVGNLNLGNGDTNHVRLAVYASQGCVYLNDRLAAELDASPLIQPGDVAVLIGDQDKTLRAGASTSYKDFTLYRADSLVCP